MFARALRARATVKLPHMRLGTGSVGMFYFCLVETDLLRPHLEWLPGETLGAAQRFERQIPDQHRKPAATYIYAEDERVDIPLP